MEGGKPENPEKNPRSRDENQQQTQSTYDAGSGIEPGPHWWEASALTTAPSLLPIKPYARALQKDPIIRGIKVRQNEIKSAQYADDTTVSVRDLESVPHLMKLLVDFKVVRGLEINKHKTEAMWLGYWRNRNDKPFGFKWLQDSVHAHGVHFSYGSQLTDKLN